MPSSRALVVALATVSGAIVIAADTPEAHAQGCVASRLNAPSDPVNPEGNEYYLPKGK